MDESFTTDENVDLDNVVEEEEETITSGSSTAGDIRNLILSINTTREMLIKCGYKSVTIDTSKATVIETMDGKRKEIIPANEKDNKDLVSLHSLKLADNENDDPQQEDLQQQKSKGKMVIRDSESDQDADLSDDDHDDEDNESDKYDELLDDVDHDDNHGKRNPSTKRRRVEVESGEVESIETVFSGPTYLIVTNLNRLLKNLDRLPSPAPTWNPELYEDIKTYNEALLRKLESTAGQIEFSKKRFLEVPALTSEPPQTTSMTSSSSYSSGSLAHILNNENDDGVKFFDIPYVMSEKSLLSLSGKEFSDSKEVVIKTLSLQVLKIYDKVLSDYVKEEISRRSRLRYYVSILNIYRKIELYCSLHELRKKEETIKNQALNKIVMYSKRENPDQVPKFLTEDFKKIIRAAKRIERLVVGISGGNWGILDAFPNIDVDFFKSTSISAADFERFLKFVETGQLISKSDGNQLYQSIKSEQNQEREKYIQSIYESISE